MDHTCFCDVSGLQSQSTAGDAGTAGTASPLVGSRSPLVSAQSPAREWALSASRQGRLEITQALLICVQASVPMTTVVLRGH